MLRKTFQIKGHDSLDYPLKIIFYFLFETITIIKNKPPTKEVSTNTIPTYSPPTLYY